MIQRSHTRVKDLVIAIIVAVREKKFEDVLNNTDSVKACHSWPVTPNSSAHWRTIVVFVGKAVLDGGSSWPGVAGVRLPRIL